MNRDLSALSDRSFDLLVVGGGILGACVAWDAALRGFAVALVEQGDFASRTSSNSLKIVHGGLRYLQHLDIPRMRASIRERSAWLRIAPHLVEPLPVLIPTYGHGMRSRLLLRLAMALNDLVSADRNRHVQPGRHLPAGRSLSRRECLHLVPELDSPRLTGGVLFHDAQTYSSERLVLEVIEAATSLGAVVANYVACVAPLREGGRLVGAQLKDRLGDQHLAVRAGMVVNAAGPAVPSLAARLSGSPRDSSTAFSVALNLMLDGLGHPVAFTIEGPSEDPTAILSRGKRQLFVTPWRGRSLIGTAHYPFAGDPTEFKVQEQDVRRFVAEVNAGWPGRHFSLSDVKLVHGGLVPARREPGKEVHPLKRPRIIDHALRGAPGLISAISVKFTTARVLAERVVDLAARRLGRGRQRCRTASTPLPGAGFSSPEELQRSAERRYGGTLELDILHHLVRAYGCRYEAVLAYRDTVPGWDGRLVPGAPVIKAQLVRGAREEMAQSIEDLLMRRTEIGARGLASDSAAACAREVLKAG